MKNALKQLLDDLDRLAEEHGEVTDTHVRDVMHDAVYHTLVEPRPGYRIPDEYAMSSPEGDEQVRSVLARFLAHSEVAAARTLATPRERLAAFQNGGVVSSAGNSYDEYFGHNPAFD